MDSVLEAFRHNPADDSLAASASTVQLLKSAAVLHFVFRCRTGWRHRFINFRGGVFSMSAWIGERAEGGGNAGLMGGTPETQQLVEYVDDFVDTLFR